MCGIVGGIAERNIVPILLEGLKRLEYRGYDSAGIVVLNQEGLQRLRSTGRVQELAEQAKVSTLRGSLGIGHTRWATHGAPSERNAHPHISSNSIAVVHNGIIENHEALRTRLQAAGYVFTSDTDTEVIAHLIHLYLTPDTNLRLATQQAIADLQGAFAIGVLHLGAPDRLVCARRGSPLLLGIGFDEFFIASDVSALLPVTQNIVYLEEGDLAELSLDGYQIYQNNLPVSRTVHISELSADVAELGQYRHYMQKEIFEQPKAIADTLEMLAAGFQPALFGVDAADIFSRINSVTILACGTSFHSASVAKYWLESVAGIACQVEIASEYRYRDSVPNPNSLIVTISQSGETADTLAALQHAISLGQTYTLTICNVPESALMRQSRLKFLTRAGPEIGVASTKAFTTQLIALYVLTHVLAKQRGQLNATQEAAALAELRGTPVLVQQGLQVEPTLREWADAISLSQHALFLGRGVCYPIAMEGALKLKEISYIHAEAYAAGELKHGPLALVDKNMPVIVVAACDAWLDKLKSNMQEVMARGGVLYVIAEEGCDIQPAPNLSVLTIPAAQTRLATALSPLLLTIPTQLLAYYTALKKGTDVDKPRNLAKSVTVE